jgi:hypothetical protein
MAQRIGRLRSVPNDKGAPPAAIRRHRAFDWWDVRSVLLAAVPHAMST